MHYKCILLVFACGIVFVNSQRIKGNMYEQINGASCFRRMNATHVTGCNSKMGGSVGVIHYVTNQSDIDFIVNDHPSPPYAAIMPPELFNRENVMRLKAASKYVSVIVLINWSENELKHFSHESRCPNQFSGLVKSNECNPVYPETSWNPFGTGLLLEDFPFPIYYVTDVQEIQKILQCFDKYNRNDIMNQKSRSLCSIEVNAFMAAAVNSEVCLRRSTYAKNFQAVRYCDPLQGRNVYATLFPREIVDIETRKNQPNEKFILVTTRMDTTSFFDGVGAGAYDVVPFAALTAVAHFLAKTLKDRKKSSDPNVLFVVFNGESYDYIGSQRFVYDLTKGAFPTKSTYTNPIGMENIDFMIDLGVLDDVSSIKIFTPGSFDEANRIHQIISTINTKFSLNTVPRPIEVTKHLPPVSAQSFLTENPDFKTVILTTEPKNRFYHSIYDDPVNMKYKYENKSDVIDYTNLENLRLPIKYYKEDSIQIKIRNFSSVLGMAIYELITNESYKEDFGTSSVLIDEFLHCFLESSECPLFRAAGRPDAPRNSDLPPYRYISVYSSLIQNATYFASKILGFLVGQTYSNLMKENCTQKPFSWMAGYSGKGECHLTTQNYTIAMSPAFVNDTYEWSSNRYSTWTESTWRELSARIFLKPSTLHETWTLTIGIVTILLSFIFVFFINSKSDILFNQDSASIPITPTQC